MGVSTSLDTNGIRGMKLTDCHNIDDFRALAKRRLPWPVFDYIDGAPDDEVTRRRNRDAFDSCDLIPRVLAGMERVDMRTTPFGREEAMPLSLSLTVPQRLFHSQGERAGMRNSSGEGKRVSFHIILGGSCL